MPHGLDGEAHHCPGKDNPIKTRGDEIFQLEDADSLSAQDGVEHTSFIVPSTTGPF